MNVNLTASAVRLRAERGESRDEPDEDEPSDPCSAAHGDSIAPPRERAGFAAPAQGRGTLPRTRGPLPWEALRQCGPVGSG